jgi:hypothetical protein
MIFMTVYDDFGYWFFLHSTILMEFLIIIFYLKKIIYKITN